MFRRAHEARDDRTPCALGAQGIKIMSAGRLNGIEIARTEWYREGRVPLHTAARRYRLRICRSQDHLRRDRHQGVGVQGRGAGQRRAAGAPRPRPRPERKAQTSRSQATCCSQLEVSTASNRKAGNNGVATRGDKVSFGEYGLKATGRGRLTARQIEAARRAMTRHIKRGGRIWIRIFPDKPISQKPAEVRMGNGKGNPGVLTWPRSSPARCSYEMDGGR